ncbi:MAG: diaminopimelate dehydrogenase [Clostridia bacterium]|nr:diaminopimelate dehydrogenase [Clostridia bacterium]
MIRIGLYGYGNIARGVECAAAQNADLTIAAVFTRRDPATVTTQGAPVYRVDDVLAHRDEIDVLVMCGGSATDLPQQTPQMAEYFNVVDTFDTHKRIPEHFANVDAAAKKGGKTAVISVGWDPGLFSLNRMLGNCFLPDGADYTFWGRGVSQGHSDAVRRIDGVLDARQYTVPVESALEAVRRGEQPELTARQKHTRECYVVAAEGADRARIEREIVTMKNYFDEYDTTVHFITQEELDRDHKGIPHGGTVIRSGRTGRNGENRHEMEFRLRLDSNPEFTACVVACCARAACRMNAEGQTGCKTIFDIPPAYLSPLSGEELRAKML